MFDKDWAFEFELRLNHGYFLIIYGKDESKEHFINEIKDNYANIEIINEYSFKDPWSLKDKLKDHPVLLVNVESKLNEACLDNKNYHKENYNTDISDKVAVYCSLIGLREYLRDNPVIILCNKEIARMIQCNDPQLSAFARNAIYLDDDSKKIKNRKFRNEY